MVTSLNLLALGLYSVVIISDAHVLLKWWSWKDKYRIESISVQKSCLHPCKAD
jgi:hypothetical protein